MEWLRKLLRGGGDVEPKADVMEQRQTDLPGRFVQEDVENRAARQEADTTGLVRTGEPRGGMSAEAYNTADPRDIVEEDGVAMAGPAGAPQEGTTPSERRADQRDETD
jgi:hypothetical protein